MPNYPDNPTWLIVGYPSALSFLDWRARYIRSLNLDLSPQALHRLRGREERYLIVACTVITDVPEAVGP
jgi:hypothetical protein